MINNKGFTLTEVLLAAMIVGIIGIALAALTTSALRESNIGRTRIMLRNQMSLFLRQLRQDVLAAREMGISSDGKQVVLAVDNKSITYNCTCSDDGGQCVRSVGGSGETILGHVQCSTNTDIQMFNSQSIVFGENNVLKVYLIVGLNGNPPIKEVINETFVLPQGVVSKNS